MRAVKHLDKNPRNNEISNLRMVDMPKHTRGPVIAAPTHGHMRDDYKQPFAVASAGKANLIAGCFGDGEGGHEAAEANAELIAEAFNVAAETGMTPRQLARSVNRLVVALDRCYHSLFEAANILAGDRTGHLAVNFHREVNRAMEVLAYYKAEEK